MITFPPHSLLSVYLPLPVDSPFTYRASLSVPLGAFVVVPFGRRLICGVVVGLAPALDFDESKVKDILSLCPVAPLSEALCRFIPWMATYTLNPSGLILKLFLPKTIASALVPAIPPKRARKSRSSAIALTPSDPIIPVLNDSQRDAVSSMLPLPDSHSVTLLDGVPGAGKTEVYFTAMAEVLSMGKQVLLLLPEIALSTQFIVRVSKRFGFEPLVWHSDILASRKSFIWHHLASGMASLVLGTRSSLFLPYTNLGLVVIDEEHDTSYKQEEGVVYHGRDMGVALAYHFSAPVILASATPSLETLHNVAIKKYQRVVLPHRHGNQQLPSVRLIDMNTHPPAKDTLLSPLVVAAMHQTLAKKEQILLFLNKRGFSSLLICRGCGHRLSCPDCSAYLTYHQGLSKNPILLCHHCNHRQSVPDACPSCQQETLFARHGLGVEQVEMTVQNLFPHARYTVASSDTVQSIHHAQELVQRIESFDVDIIIGTQMIAKGYHFPLLTMAVVVDADMGFSSVDLRANEHTYHLLYQLAGRAGRESHLGSVFLQTYTPTHHGLQALVHFDRDSFVQHELSLRHASNMPPYGKLIAVIFSHGDVSLVQQAASYGARLLSGAGIHVLGPAPAPMLKIRGRTRYRLLLPSRAPLARSTLRAWRLAVLHKHPKISITIDVDPITFY